MLKFCIKVFKTSLYSNIKYYIPYPPNNIWVTLMLKFVFCLFCFILILFLLIRISRFQANKGIFPSAGLLMFCIQNLIFFLFFFFFLICFKFHADCLHEVNCLGKTKKINYQSSAEIGQSMIKQ